MQSAINKLNRMVGQSWMYKTIQLKILSVKVLEEKVMIVTDKDWIEVPLHLLDVHLRDFLEVEQEYETALMSKSNQAVETIINTHSNINTLKDILLENIKNVKKDRLFIGQAKSINDNVNTIVEMMKLEVDMVREIRKQQA